jgi:hypothetical protein
LASSAKVSIWPADIVVEVVTCQLPRTVFHPAAPPLKRTFRHEAGAGVEREAAIDDLERGSRLGQNIAAVAAVLLVELAEYRFARESTRSCL